MQNDVHYIFLDSNFNQLFTKSDRQAPRVPQKGEVLQLKHTVAKDQVSHFGKVLMVVESKHLFGFPKLEDCAVQLSKTLVYVQSMQVENNNVPPYLQLLEQLEAGVEVLSVMREATMPKIEIKLLPTVYADGRMELLPSIDQQALMEAALPVIEEQQQEEPAGAFNTETASNSLAFAFGLPVVRKIIRDALISYPTKKKLVDVLQSVKLDEQATDRKIRAVFKTLAKEAKIRKDSAEKLIEAANAYIEKGSN